MQAAPASLAELRHARTTPAISRHGGQPHAGRVNRMRGWHGSSRCGYPPARLSSAPGVRAEVYLLWPMAGWRVGHLYRETDYRAGLAEAHLERLLGLCCPRVQV